MINDKWSCPGQATGFFNDYNKYFLQQRLMKSLLSDRFHTGSKVTLSPWGDSAGPALLLSEIVESFQVWKIVRKTSMLLCFNSPLFSQLPPTLFSYCDWLNLCLLAKEQGLIREKWEEQYWNCWSQRLIACSGLSACLWGGKNWSTTRSRHFKMDRLTVAHSLVCMSLIIW